MCGRRIIIWPEYEPTIVTCTRGRAHEGPHRDGHLRYGWDQGATSGAFYSDTEDYL